MADRIKGITIEIGGNTTKLTASLKDTNKTIKDTQSQLRDVEKLLKLDPKNTELLAQKQRLLGQAVGETKEKLDTLKKASEQAASTHKNYDAFQAKFAPIQNEISSTETTLKKLKQQMAQTAETDGPDSEKYKALAAQAEEAEGKMKTLLQQSKECREEFGNPISTEQWEGLQREIVATEQQLKNLEKQSRESRTNLKEIGETLQKTGEGISSAGKSMLPVTAAVAGVGTVAIKTASDFDTAMSQVQATMGIAKDAISELNGESVNTVDALRDLAKQMGSETAFSAKECAEALNYLALAGYDTQQIYDTLPTVLNLAAAGGIDLAAASDMVTDAMSALGMATEDADVMVDQMAKTASSTNTSVAQLGEGILKIGATAKTVKGGTAELNTALGILANNGIKGAEGGTNLRNVILSLQTPGKDAAGILDDLGVSAYDSEGNMRSLNDTLSDLNTATSEMTTEEKQNILSKIFNKTDLAAVNSLLSSTGDSWDVLQQKIADSGGAAQQMADTQLDNLAGQTTILQSSIEGLSISLGEMLIPYIQTAVEWIQGVVDKMNEMDEGQLQTIITIALVVAAIGPLLIVIGQVVSAIGMVSQGISFLIANPMALLIAGIVALVLLIATKGDEIQAILKKVDDFVTGIFITDWRQIFGPTLGGILNAFSRTLRDIWDGIMLIFNGIIDFIRGVFTGDWDRAWRGVSNIFRGIFSTLEGIAKAPINGIIGLLNGAISAINKLIRGFNSIGFDMPWWLGGGSFHPNIPTIGNIPYLAKGGVLSSGSAIVGEAGPELLTIGNGRAVVQPLAGNNGNIESLLGDIRGMMGTGQTSPIVIQVTLDGRIVGQAVYNYMGDRGRRDGR